jgi:hypothetical protein
MGPSKEELANYFKHNRKYFGELAKNFKITDPEYYNKYIAPFYHNQLITPVNKKGAPRFVLAIAGASFALVMGIVMVVTITQNARIKKNTEEFEKLGNRETENVKIDEKDFFNQTDLSKMADTMEAVKDMANFNEGMFFYKIQDFENARKYLEEVTEKCPKYPDAEKILKEIKKSRSKKK